MFVTQKTEMSRQLGAKRAKRAAHPILWSLLDFLELVFYTALYYCVHHFSAVQATVSHNGRRHGGCKRAGRLLLKMPQDKPDTYLSLRMYANTKAIIPTLLYLKNQQAKSKKCTKMYCAHYTSVFLNLTFHTVSLSGGVLTRPSFKSYLFYKRRLLEP